MSMDTTSLFPTNENQKESMLSFHEYKLKAKDAYQLYNGFPSLQIVPN